MRLGRENESGVVDCARRTATSHMLPKRGALVQGQFAAIG
jgi:hypothetical protein